MKLEYRAITEEDTALVLGWRNKESVRRYFIHQREITEDEHMRWLDKIADGQVVQFIIIADGEPVGCVYLQDIDHAHRKAEFGIFIGEDNVRGGGIGGKATKMIVDYGFNKLDLHRIYLRVYETNERAIASYEKAGFRREGLLVDDVFVNGAYHNMIIMAVVNGQ